MDATTFLAWWGASLSTVVFAWDIYKWWTTGPKVHYTVQSGMKSFNIPEYEGKTLLLANVTNTGDRPTTIINLGFLHYANLWAELRNRPDKAFVIPHPSTAQPLPFELKSGNVWSGTCEQDAEVENMAKNGQLYCVLYHSHQSKPIKRRVLIPV